MTLRSVLAVTLGATLAVAPSVPAAGVGTLQGSLTTVSGSRVSGADVELVSLDNGALKRLQTDGDGAFEASLEPGSYKLELQKDYVVVRGPRMVTVVTGNTIQAELVVADAAGAPATGTEAAVTSGSPNRGGNIVALALFSGALAGAAVYAAGNHEDRKPPTTSGSR